MHSDLAWMTIEEVAPLVATRAVSPRDLLESVFRRIQQYNSTLNAYMTLDLERARADAQRAEAEILHDRHRGPLHGIPIALKDNIWTAGLRTTAGSKILADFVPAEDATVVRRLRRAGAVIVGKTNMSEFAYGATNNNAHYGPTRNPWNLERTTGGSSGGSAAAVAAGLAFAALGTDTGGSIRIPSALCGVVGLKPTFGVVSCHGTMPLVPPYDHVGPIARSPADAALMLKAIAGRHRRGPRAASKPLRGIPPDTAAAGRAFQLGRPRDYYFDRLAPDVARCIDRALAEIEGAGAIVREVRLADLQQATDRCTPFAYAQATTVHRRMGYFPARARDYGADVLDRLQRGAEVLAIDCAAAEEARRTIRAEFAAALANVDAIIAPTVPIGAPAIGRPTVRIGHEEESVRNALIRLNRPANIAGLPSLTVPCGFDADGLPVAVQFVGRAFSEATLLQVASFYIQNAGGGTVRRPTAV
jgi:aspartyl-tRNA(Asn)/glutamyl-tRNA(Gln) amidotransferase subunit A